MNTKPLPRFIDEIRPGFVARMTNNMSRSEKEKLNAEYLQALEKAKKNIEVERQQIAKTNTEAFFKNPQVIIDELNEIKGQGFDLGEMLIARGIATVTHKRFGKGVQVGEGSDFPHTISNFKVTVKIGDKVTVIESGSANDRYSLERLDSSAAEIVALRIAKP